MSPPTVDKHLPHADFGTEFDRRLAWGAVGAVFTLDGDRELRLCGDRSREAHAAATDAAPIQADRWHHCLYRDRATGFVQYILVTSPTLCESHPRADIVRFATQSEAFTALASLGELPLVKGVFDDSLFG